MPVCLTQVTTWLSVKIYTTVEHDFRTTCYERPPVFRDRFLSISGISLLWVFIYGLIIMYIFALCGFAFYRELFDAQTGLYCSTLYECSVTMLHRGFILGILEVFKRSVKYFLTLNCVPLVQFYSGELHVRIVMYL